VRVSEISPWTPFDIMGYEMRIEDKLHGVTTPVEVTFSGDRGSLGSGFFFFDLVPKADEGPQWRKLRGQYLVTNKHVVLPSEYGGTSALDHIQELRFFFRKAGEGGQSMEKVSRVLDRNELIDRVMLHQNPEVDICLVDIGKLVTDEIQQAASDALTEPIGLGYLYHGIVDSDFPGASPISVHAGDDVLVVGYPRGLYDEANVFPIVKRGTIATRWRAHFMGMPYFLIDTQLYKGSSGSLVITKPQDHAVKDGKLMTTEDPQYCFLGIYSAEPVKKVPPLDLETITISGVLSYGLGVVWYYDLIPHILSLPRRPGEDAAM